MNQTDCLFFTLVAGDGEAGGDYHSKHKHWPANSLDQWSDFDELTTAESIYPCLDHFNILLKQRLAGSRRNRHSGSNVRHLIRVYWASKEVVHSIHRARVRLESDPRYPHHSHHHYHHNHRRPHHHSANRPSKLLELRQLNYVREYSLTESHSELLRVKCDIFEPRESIFYCFVFVILRHSSVLAEYPPHCVPSLRHSATFVQTAVLAESSHTEPNPGNGQSGLVTGGEKKYLNDDYSPLSKQSISSTASLGESNEWDHNRIPPPGPAYDLVRRNEMPDGEEETDYFANQDHIRQFALKSTNDGNDQSDYRRNSAGQRRKVLIQSRACHCTTSESASQSSDNLMSRNSVVGINLTHSETIVLHLIITSCPISEWRNYDRSSEVKLNDENATEDGNYDPGSLGKYFLSFVLEN